MRKSPVRDLFLLTRIEPKFTGSAQFYLGVVVKEKGIDELQHFRLEMGNHIEVTVGKAGLVFSQRDNDRFEYVVPIAHLVFHTIQKKLKLPNKTRNLIIPKPL